MTFKIFGVAGPNEQLQEDFHLLLSLDERQIELVSEWLSSAANLYPEDWQEFSGLSQGIQLSVRETSRVVSVARYIVNNWKTQNLALEEVLADLDSLDLDDRQRERAAKFFSTAGDAREKVHRAALKRVYEQMALPTIDDIRITWDLRPLFEAVAYTAGKDSTGFDSLVGNVYVLLLEISASRLDGQRASQTYQFSEDEFERLIVALTRAKRQLEVFKKRVL